ncbi:MAG: 30S ribosome-binding factor RbfA [Spirochaetes bacterium]|nr:MAG: 30S ribosome-binding factor RbfA [Spirochaetota bacterium]
MPELRLKKVETLLQQEISIMINTNKVKDPRVSTLISVFRAEVSKDLNYAKIYVSGMVEEEQIEKSVHALNHAAGFIQAMLRKRLRIKKIPRLSFFQDRSIEEGFIINKKIEGLIS